MQVWRHPKGKPGKQQVVGRQEDTGFSWNGAHSLAFED